MFCAVVFVLRALSLARETCTSDLKAWGKTLEKYVAQLLGCEVHMFRVCLNPIFGKKIHFS